MAHANACAVLIRLGRFSRPPSNLSFAFWGYLANKWVMQQKNPFSLPQFPTFYAVLHILAALLKLSRGNVWRIKEFLFF